jgi:hypothetical protein
MFTVLPTVSVRTRPALWPRHGTGAIRSRPSRFRLQAGGQRGESNPSDDPAAADSVEVVDYEDAAVDIFGELTSGDLTLKTKATEAQSLGLTPLSIDEITDMEYEELKCRCTELLEGLGIEMEKENSTYPGGQPQRAVFCTRTLNLRSIQAIGLDMDYTLVDYDVDAWEGRAVRV